MGTNESKPRYLEKDGKTLQIVRGVVVARVSVTGIGQRGELFKVAEKYGCSAWYHNDELRRYVPHSPLLDCAVGDIVIYTVDGVETCGTLCSCVELFADEYYCHNARRCSVGCCGWNFRQRAKEETDLYTGYVVKRLWQMKKGRQVDAKKGTFDNLAPARVLFKLPSGVPE